MSANPSNGHVVPPGGSGSGSNPIDLTGDDASQVGQPGGTGNAAPSTDPDVMYVSTNTTNQPVGEFVQYGDFSPPDSEDDEEDDILETEANDARSKRVLVGGWIRTAFPGVVIHDPQDLPREQPPEQLQAVFAWVYTDIPGRDRVRFHAAPFRVNRSELHPGDSHPWQLGWPRVPFNEISRQAHFATADTEERLKRRAYRWLVRELKELAARREEQDDEEDEQMPEEQDDPNDLDYVA